jgi:hypothetical protein
MGREKEAAVQGKEMIVNTNPLPRDADELVALAQAIATVLAEKQEELGISTDFEALLRVSITAASYAIDRYIAVLSAVTKSPAAVHCLKEARTRCSRTITRLRRQVAHCIGQLCRQMDERELLKVAKYVCWVAA